MDVLIVLIGSLIFLILGIGTIIGIAKLCFWLAAISFQITMAIMRFYISIFMMPYSIVKWIFKWILTPLYRAVIFSDIRDTSKQVR